MAGRRPASSAIPRRGTRSGSCARLARALANEVPSQYVFGLDMGLAEEDAAIFVDELNDRGVSTGLPRALGGLPYDQLGVTGFGVAEAADAAAQLLDLDLRGARVAIQGFGAVGRAAAERLHELGAVVVAVSTAAGWAYDADGLDLAELVAAANDLDDDCVTVHPSFSPAARGSADRTRRRLDPGGPRGHRWRRGGPVDHGPSWWSRARTCRPLSRLEQILHQRRVVVVPDFIANAGGIVAAAHSTDARYSPFAVEPTEIFPMISDEAAGQHGPGAARQRRSPHHPSAGRDGPRPVEGAGRHDGARDSGPISTTSSGSSSSALVSA